MTSQSKINSAKLSCLMVSPSYRVDKFSASAGSASQTASAPGRLDTRLNLIVSNSFACNPASGIGLKYRCLHCGTFDFALWTWPVRTDDERMLAVLNKVSVRRTLHAWNSVAYQLWRCGFVFELILERGSSFKEGSTGSVTLGYVRMVSWQETFICPQVVQAGRKSVEVVDNHAEGRSRNLLWTTTFRLPTMEKWQSKKFKQARPGPSCPRFL